jgi:protocatechuate 3,4-dioxygenase beta subunit
MRASVTHHRWLLAFLLALALVAVVGTALRTRPAERLAERRAPERALEPAELVAPVPAARVALQAAAESPATTPAAAPVLAPPEPLAPTRVWRVHGRVEDEAGRPVAEARVFADASDRTRKSGVETDADGRYEVLLLDAREARRLRSVVTWPRQHQSRGVPLAFDDEAFARGELECDLVVELGASLTVRVRDEQGRPVEAALVRVLDVHKNWGNLPRFSREDWLTLGVYEVGQGSVGAFADTDADGRHDFRNLPWGACLLTVWHPEFLPVVNRPIEVGASSSEALVVLRAGSVVRGRVLDPDGRALAGATVTLGRSGGGGTALSDAEGRFRVAGLPPGELRVTLLCKHPDHAPVFDDRFELVPGEEYEIRMLDGATWRFALHDALTHRPIEGDVEVSYGFQRVYSSLSPSKVLKPVVLPLVHGELTVERVAPFVEHLVLQAPGYDLLFHGLEPRTPGEFEGEVERMFLVPSRNVRVECLDSVSGESVSGWSGHVVTQFLLGGERAIVGEYALSAAPQAGGPGLYLDSATVPYTGECTLHLQAPGYSPLSLSLVKEQILLGETLVVSLDRAAPEQD